MILYSVKGSCGSKPYVIFVQVLNMQPCTTRYTSFSFPERIQWIHGDTVILCTKWNTVALLTRDECSWNVRQLHIKGQDSSPCFLPFLWLGTIARHAAVINGLLLCNSQDFHCSSFSTLYEVGCNPINSTEKAGIMGQATNGWQLKRADLQEE